MQSSVILGGRTANLDGSPFRDLRRKALYEILESCLGALEDGLTVAYKERVEVEFK